MKSYIICFLFVVLGVFAEESKERLLFRPLTANPFESRVGCFYQNNTEKLRLDIGASIDLLQKETDNGNKFDLGTDFMTYTRLRHNGRLKFPVETSDYFFGINSSYKFKDIPLSLRLRAAHISSHLVDGYATDTVFWQKPYVYSREFVDLVAAYNIADGRVYAGLNYVFSTQPKNVTRVVPQLGFDYSYKIFERFYIESGYDFKLMGDDKILQGANAIQLGILHKMSANNGIFIGYYGYFGPSIHGMFYRTYESYHGLGFQVYFY